MQAGCSQVAGGVLLGQIAPPLKGPSGRRLNPHNCRVQHDAAPSDPVLTDDLIEPQDQLSR